MANSPARVTIDVGSVIAGTYTIEALIGQGGMGAVFLASHNRLPGKKVAIKMLHADVSNDEVLARFKREADIASRLDHPNIVKVDDYDFLPDGTPYIRLEYLQGESLAQRLKGGALPVEQVMYIARQVGSALAAAHRAGIVHRDLKPQNIFLVPTEVDGQSIEIAKVLDFGISKIRGSSTVQTQDSALLGTPQYMAPEQATGQQASVDERTDEFALAAIVYEMLTGQPAFQGASIPEVVFKVVYEQPVPLAQLVPALAPEVVACVTRAMSKPSAERFPTVTEFVETMTGRPLATTRATSSLPPPDTGAITGSRASKVRRTGNDAFAQTVGSGDHSADVPAPVRGSAPTVESQRGIGTTGTIAGESTPKPRSAKRGLIVGATLAVAVLGGLAFYLSTRGSGEQPAAVAITEPPRPTTQTSPPVGPTQVASEPAKTEPAKPTQVAKTEPAKTEPAKTEPTKPAVPTRAAAKPPEAKKPADTKPSGDDTVRETDTGGDENAKQRLDEAEEALRVKDTSRAERLATSVINGESSGANQKVHAHLIRGMIACEASDQEHAMIELRSVTRNYQRMHKRLLETCRKAGVTLED